MSPNIVVGSPVQYIHRINQPVPALVVLVNGPDADYPNTVNLLVFGPPHLAGVPQTPTLMLHVKQEDPDATVAESAVFRPLPIPAAPVAEFPLSLFVETVKPLIEEAARMRVEEILAERSSSPS